MRRALIVSMLLIMLVTACAPDAAPTEEATEVTGAPTEVTEVPTEPAAPPDATGEPGSMGPLEEIVIEQLAEHLGLQESDITVVSSEEAEFSDACLGVTMEGVMCAQVVTPGRVIMLEADGVQYEYHTSEDGNRVQPASLAMVWKREGGIAGFCDALTVFRSGEVFTSSCKSQQAEGTMGSLARLLTSSEQKEFHQWVSEFGEAELDASDPKGVADGMVLTLAWFGSGDAEPSELEQQELFNFAQDLYQELAK
jgi:hypothetical protein